jgi:O-antigen/teichoic acid export membrane protein
MSSDLKRRTLTAMLWSGLQNWLGKLLTLGLFLILARILSPSELGAAAASILLVTLAIILAEQGYPEAIIQRRDLKDADLNLPFVVSMVTALCVAMLIALLAGPISRWVGGGATENLILLSALIPPLSTLAVFQSATRKRSLDFKGPAKAVLAATLVAGVVAVTLAIQGFGAASIVAQAAAIAAMSALLLWTRPKWRPRRHFDGASFKSLLTYSQSAFGSRLLDFAAVRLIELIILTRLGAVGLGIYVVGSKLYQTLLQLLAGTIAEVALAALSRTSGDQTRLRDAYLKLVYFGSATTMPLFVGVAAVSTELCELLFGARWEGVAEVTMWLCLLGAVQSVQFYNGSVIGAVGKARTLLHINILKAVSAFVFLGISPGGTVLSLAIAFVLSQLVTFPFSLWCALRAAEATVFSYIRQVWPGVVSAGVGFAAVHVVSGFNAVESEPTGIRLVALLSVYALCVVGALIVFSKGRIIAELKALKKLVRAP